MDWYLSGWIVSAVIWGVLALMGCKKVGLKYSPVLIVASLLALVPAVPEALRTSNASVAAMVVAGVFIVRLLLQGRKVQGTKTNETVGRSFIGYVIAMFLSLGFWLAS